MLACDCAWRAEPAGRNRDAGLARRRLARTRDIRPVRRPLSRSSRVAAHHDARKLGGASVAQRLPCRRLSLMPTTVHTVTGDRQTMVLNMGPQHPSTHGVLRVVLELDGETVVKARPEIGYLHTGIEKSCEALTYSQAITLTDRIDYLSPMSNNLGYCLAVEKLLALEIPKR